MLYEYSSLSTKHELSPSPCAKEQKEITMKEPNSNNKGHQMQKTFFDEYEERCLDVQFQRSNIGKL